MSELKPCQNEAETLEIIESMLDVADMKNTGPIYADDPPRSGLCRIPEEDAAILRQYIAERRTQPANEPLTLEQLKEMDGEPVWITGATGLAFVNARCAVLDSQPCNGVLIFFTDQSVPMLKVSDYGETWLAYAHKPGGTQND